jgi:hypothetical protein
MDKGNWIKFEGSQCPVDSETYVDVKWMLDKTEVREESNVACRFAWGNITYPIIAYRISKEHHGT